jgi:hypothetical protein
MVGYLPEVVEMVVAMLRKQKHSRTTGSLAIRGEH